MEPSCPRARRQRLGWSRGSNPQPFPPQSEPLQIMSVKDSLKVELLSCRATTNLDLFLRPSRKVTTKLLTSSVLLEVKEYSSCLMVARVKAPPLKERSFEMSDQKTHVATFKHHQKNGELGPSPPPPTPLPAARNCSDFWEGEF